MSKMEVYKHLKGRSRCFVFDKLFELARFLEHQNQSVQKTPMFVCRPTQPRNHHRRKHFGVELVAKLLNFFVDSKTQCEKIIVDSRLFTVCCNSGFVYICGNVSPLIRKCYEKDHLSELEVLIDALL